MARWVACLFMMLTVLTGADAERRLETRAEDVDTARIVGTVTLGPQLVARRKFTLYSDPGRLSQVRAKPSLRDEMPNVVVYLQSVPATGPPRSVDADRPIMRQAQLTFSPHVLPVVKDTVVEFPNEDSIFHNVFSLSKAASFDLGRYPRGVTKSVQFTTPGIVKVFCHIHSDMSAVVVVLDNPFFATPDREGRFEIDGVPPGEYTVVGWHERAQPVSRNIRVGPGDVTSIDFAIPATEGSGSD